jgi:hypothetical protein
MGLLRASFGDLGGAIFAGLLSSFSLIPSPWRWIEEERTRCVAVSLACAVKPTRILSTTWEEIFDSMCTTHDSRIPHAL